MYSVSWNRVSDVKEYFNKVPHWLFVSDNNTEMYPSNVNQNKIYERILKDKDGSLSIKRFAKEPLDTIRGMTLKPRSEIRPLSAKLTKGKNHHVRYELSFVKGYSQFRGLVFQIMGHAGTNPLPSFQLEMRDLYLHARWTEIGDDNKNINTHIVKVHQPRWDGLEYIVADIYITPSFDQKKGIVKVYINGVKKFERVGRNCSSDKNQLICSYGCYGTEGVDMEIKVKSLLVE